MHTLYVAITDSWLCLFAYAYAFACAYACVASGGDVVVVVVEIVFDIVRFHL
ncbi:predicted protein [Sclerotinia sclerotiorum 1980 UF-70]|uniref:Uncharacterized protein n=1 Tax=Sclerotinia sclerotiorum (strain ATCC 18683 / 1980 / Ss-1) TaxID=665079 RepID=A7ED38_SCLS1|nr:predicted protein [Sclerotinia sclerotiorum 1980 UF-70]EDO00754.1 predicted protein [Sclerotinia sclerotiorum 1980 UF-70]